MITRYYKTGIILCVFFFLQCTPSTTKGLYMESKENGTITKLEDSYSEINWSPSGVPVYFIDADRNVQTSFTLSKNSEDTYRMSLSITNTGDDSIRVEPHFPQIKQWKFEGTDPADIYQLFPRQGEIANNVDSARYEEIYSGNFPFQFVDISNQQEGGLSIRLLDETNYPKKFLFNRQHNLFDFEVIHRSKQLCPGETWNLPAVEISAHKGDWHAAFYAYRNWLKDVLRPVTERKEWFRDVYNFRQAFLYDNCGETGSHDLKTKKIHLEEKVKESAEAFGGVDYLHLFDWGQTPDYGRCGDYNPWYYVDKEELHAQIQKIRSWDVPVGLYHEGYLLSPNSNICKEHGAEWQMLDKNGKKYERFGPGYYYPCPSDPEWREYIAKTVSRSSGELGADGVYIDQFGFGWQYGCYNPAHNHDVFHTSVNSEWQVPAEAGLMEAIKKKLPSSIVTYTEECPTDISTQYQDGSFTYAISVGRDSSRHNPAAVNLARFAFPDYKLFEILHIDRPAGNDTTGIKHVFFNGEGIWLSGAANNSEWFSEDVKRNIRKCYAILRDHRDAFRSLEPEPLVKTMNDCIKANYFPIQNKCVWTFYNISDQLYEGNAIEIEAVKGAQYYDAWNNRDIEPIVKGDKVIIRLPIQAKDVGCLIQYLKK